MFFWSLCICSPRNTFAQKEGGTAIFKLNNVSEKSFKSDSAEIPDILMQLT